jgi:hypothetical protein
VPARGSTASVYTEAPVKWIPLTAVIGQRVSQRA